MAIQYNKIKFVERIIEVTGVDINATVNYEDPDEGKV